jgi:hypothetical protein
MKTIFIVYKQHYDYGSQAENIKAFESQTRAEEYISRLKELYTKAHKFYDELAGNPSMKEIELMDEEVWTTFELFSTKRNKYYGYDFGFEEIPVFDMTIKMSIDFNRASKALENMTQEDWDEMFKLVERIPTPEEEYEDYLNYRIDATLLGGGQISYFYDGVITHELDRKPIYKTKHPEFNKIIESNLITLESLASNKENPCELIDILVASTMLLLEEVK